MEVGPDQWVYPHHFPDDPVFPGCLMRSKGPASSWPSGHVPTAPRRDPRLIRSEARFRRPVGPDQPLLRLRADEARRRRRYLGFVELFTPAEDAVASVSIALSIRPRA